MERLYRVLRGNVLIKIKEELDEAIKQALAYEGTALVEAIADSALTLCMSFW